MSKEIKIGYSTGPLRNLKGERLNTEDAMKLIREFGSDVLELGQRVVKVNNDNSSEIEALREDSLEEFSWVSLHAPKYKYGYDEESKNIFEQIKQINEIRKLDLVVVHPDLVKDFSFFEGLDLPIAFENSDHRKPSYKNVEDMIKITEQYPEFSVCIDVNHAWTIDRSMKLAGSFFDNLWNRIEEIHVSGYDSIEDIHYPLYKTLQPEIVGAIRNKSIPLIIESAATSVEEMEKEKNYILEILD